MRPRGWRLSSFEARLRGTLRRLTLPLVAVAALASTASASADLRPVRRDFGDHRVPLVRAGEVQVPAVRARGRVRVIVRLGGPPLAAWQSGRRLQGVAAPAQLNVRSASSRAYLARLAAAQRAAVAELRREIPEARVGRRFRVLLNGLTVDLPASRLPALMRTSFATKVLPSVRYTLRTNWKLVVSAASGDATRLRRNCAAGTPVRSVRRGAIDHAVPCG